MISEKDEWITVRDACKLSGYNDEHIARLVRQGKILSRVKGLGL